MTKSQTPSAVCVVSLPSGSASLSPYRVLNGSNQAIWQAKVPPEIQGRVFSRCLCSVDCWRPWWDWEGMQ